MIVFDASILQQQVREVSERIKVEPLKASHRVALAHLRLLQKEHAKALQQLQVACQIEPQWQTQAQMIRVLLRAELQRAAVFEGKIKPDLVSPPPVWLACMTEALKQAPEQAAVLRAEAFEQAPESSGFVNARTSFEWLNDGDSRLGPVFELITGGSYYWVPMCDVRRVEFLPVEQPTDLLWRGVKMSLKNTLVVDRFCHMPMRYPDYPGGVLSQGMETEWLSSNAGLEEWFGVGQRLWFTETNEHAMADVCVIEFMESDIGSSAHAS